MYRPPRRLFKSSGRPEEETKKEDRKQAGRRWEPKEDWKWNGCIVKGCEELVT